MKYKFSGNCILWLGGEYPIDYLDEPNDDYVAFSVNGTNETDVKIVDYRESTIFALRTAISTEDFSKFHNIFNRAAFVDLRGDEREVVISLRPPTSNIAIYRLWIVAGEGIEVPTRNYIVQIEQGDGKIISEVNVYRIIPAQARKASKSSDIRKYRIPGVTLRRFQFRR